MLKFKEMDDKKKRLIIIVSVLVVFIGVTLAYVVGQISDGAIGNANVTADTTDNLQFSVDKDISLNPTQFNVTEGGGGLSDTAVGTATLLANSTNETATYDYYVYFNIKSNNYTYTTEDYKPEIVLTITDPEGNLVTELANSDLEYVEAENADGTITKGFDITTASGLINIASNYEITSSSSTNATEQDWTFTVTFINLTTNQTENGGSTLDAEIILSKNVTNYHEICEEGTMACDIARLYNETSPETNGLYYHDADLANGAGDNSYRYSGANLNNYVCFGATGADCQDVNNQYRIIGVFNNQVKLIKSTIYGNYVWDADSVNAWDASAKPDIYITLNTTYYNILGSEWQNLISESTWQVGGISTLGTAKETYDVEVGAGQSGYVETMKIGLMYLSDYGYGASPEKWTTALYEENYGTDNWLYLGSDEWLISRSSDTSNYAFVVNSLYGGLVSLYNSLSTNAVRPSFYLESSVVLESGVGTQENPYRIKI